jgi:hypothetical protein
LSDLSVPLPLPGVPQGLLAYVQPRADGSLPRDRRGRLKATRVTLLRDPDRDDEPPAEPGETINGVTDQDLAWVTRQDTRRWLSISRRFGDAAPEVASLLATAGVVALHCSVTEQATLGSILRWDLTPDWRRHRETRFEQHTDSVSTWTERARATAVRIEPTDPGLARALRTALGSSPLLPVLVYAAEDLVEGNSHDGPRSFSQVHFGNTKARDDVAKILTDAGASPDTLLTLGLVRSPYVGLGGPIILSTTAGQWDLSAVTGPTHFRLTEDQPLSARIEDAAVLALIENKQAAEAMCDAFPNLAVAYIAGQPSDAALELIRSLASRSSRVLIATDADLGGVRITLRLLAAVDGVACAEVLDVGYGDHVPGAPFGDLSIRELSQLSDRPDQVGAFAKACLRRGYRVEQEASIRAALSDVLAR